VKCLERKCQPLADVGNQAVDPCMKFGSASLVLAVVKFVAHALDPFSKRQREAVGKVDRGPPAQGDVDRGETKVLIEPAPVAEAGPPDAGGSHLSDTLILKVQLGL
jgi:hypothetical protein